jgi:hypothetical protein
MAGSQLCHEEDNNETSPNSNNKKATKNGIDRINHLMPNKKRVSKKKANNNQPVTLVIVVR